MTDPIQIKHYKEDITSFNQLYKEFQRLSLKTWGN